MKKSLAVIICCICFMCSSLAAAEPRTISWDHVTTYTDNTFIASSLFPVYYEIYWSTTSDFLLPSIRIITNGTTSTLYVFDAVTEGLPRQTIVYFSARARLIDGAISNYAPAYPWLVPAIPIPGKPTLNSVLFR